MSKVIGTIINNVEITLENYKDKLALAAVDINNTNKISPENIDTNTYTDKLTLKIGRYNLAFENFQTGNLIIYGNTYFFIDDLNEDGSINYSVYSSLKSSYDTEMLLRQIQNDIINISSPVEANKKLITIQSNGINLNHSVISTKNCTSQTYIYNLKIENTIDKNTKIDFNNYKYPEYSDVIIYWPLIETNYSPQILNTEYLIADKTHDFTLHTQKVKYAAPNALSAEFPDYESNVSSVFYNVSAQILNTNVNKTTDPGFFWLDNHFELDKDITDKTQSDQIKDIIYNTNGNTPNVTLVFWGYQSKSDPNNNPIISDFNCNTGNGMYISPEIVRNGDSSNMILTDSRDAVETDFSKYEYDLLKNWVMYTVEFQTGSIPNEVYQNVSGMSPWQPTETTNEYGPDGPNDSSSEESRKQIRVNIRATYVTKNNGEIVTQLLLPTHDQIDHKISINHNNQFNQPGREVSTNISFFGVKSANITNANNITGWSLWNGAVRNVILFRKFLSEPEITNLFNTTIKKYYPWLEENEYTILTQLDNNSYFGSIYCKNMHAISVLGTILQQNTQTLNLTFANR